MREAVLLTKITQERGCCNHSAHAFLSNNMFLMSSCQKNMSLQDSFFNDNRDNFCDDSLCFNAKPVILPNVT